MAPSTAFLVVSSTSAPKRVETELASALASHQRLMLWITSSALKVSPLDQVMPWRTFRVRVLASSLASQLSSSQGSKVKSRFQRTRYSLHWRAMFDISTPSKVRGSRNALMFMATRSVPPLTGVSAACALDAVRPPRASAPYALTPSAAMVAKNSRRLVRPFLKSRATASAIGCRDRSVNIILVMQASLFGCLARCPDLLALIVFAGVSEPGALSTATL